MPETVRSIRDMQPGDFVKTASGRYEEIQSVHGVNEDGTLAKPSEGGFWVTTKSGEKIDMWQAKRYYKKGDPLD